MTHHMALDIKGALKCSDKELKGLINDPIRGPLPGKEVRLHLQLALSQGKKVLPCGPCDNFDYQTGCKGHEHNEEVDS